MTGHQAGGKHQLFNVLLGERFFAGMPGGEA